MTDISFSEQAWEEFQYWMGQDKKTVKRITVLLKDYQCKGHYDD